MDGLEATLTLLGQYTERQPEISFQADRASLAMRCYLLMRAEAERAAWSAGEVCGVR